MKYFAEEGKIRLEDMIVKKTQDGKFVTKIGSVLIAQNFAK